MIRVVDKLKSMERRAVIFLAFTIACAGGIAAFLHFYFSAYQNPYMRGEIIDLSKGWQYETPISGLTALGSLETGPMLAAGETMTLYRTLDAALPGAALMIRANHQSVNVYLDGATLLLDDAYVPGQNPGMALHFITLPEDYAGKVLKVELTSPYALYAGRTSPILLGSIPSLEAYALSASMRSLIFMAVSLALGVAIILFAFVQGLGGAVRREQLAIGVFTVILALYYVCTDYVVFQFFSPFWVSALSLGLYFTFSVPLLLFFYFSFEHYQKWLLPAALLHGGFAVAAIALQLAGLVDLPRLVNLNNVFLTGLLYTVVLTVMEAIKKNRSMMLAAPFFVLAYASMLFNFNVFYFRHGVVPYSYRDTYFLLALVILVYGIWRFFREAYRQRRENELLSLQNRRAQDSYERIQQHLQEVGGLKHEIKNHLAAMQVFLDHGRTEEAQEYLARYVKQSAAVTETVYSENLLLNAILTTLYGRAGEHHIKVESDIRAVPGHIANPDVYSLLSNLTDNAIDACRFMPEDKERFIRLTMTRHEPYLNIRCVNSKTGDIVRQDGKIRTTKTDEGHGYGLLTIQRIVDAYDGMMNIAHDEHTFTVMAALKDKQD
jgi:signal transduction histidine kinase/serine protease inhibitor ecotin